MMDCSMAFRDNFPINNERMSCPHGQIRENATENECLSPLLGPSDMKNEYRVRNIDMLVTKVE